MELLDRLSAGFGDNEAFSVSAQRPSWPTNDTVVRTRPLVKHGEHYYCFLPELLFANAPFILEEWIRRADAEYFQHIFQPRTRQWMLDRSLEYLGSIFPGAQICKEVFYEVLLVGEVVRFEADAVILYDNHLLVVDIVPGRLSAPAGRGGLRQLEDEYRTLADNAFAQLHIAWRYLTDVKEPLFIFEDGSTALSFTPETPIAEIYYISITQENLGPMAMFINQWCAPHMRVDRHFPWCVFAGDLKVISELVESPAEFLRYVKEGVSAPVHSHGPVFDELTRFSYYLQEEFYVDGVFDAMEPSFPDPTLCSERYYDYLDGKGTLGDKPTLVAPGAFKDLLQALERTGKPGRTQAQRGLLSMSPAVRKRFGSELERLTARAAEHGESNDCSFVSHAGDVGITICVCPHSEDEYFLSAQDTCREDKYVSRSRLWILINVVAGKNGARNVDFSLFDYPWEYDPEMEQEAEKVRPLIDDTTLDLSVKTGRNDPCPCGSGKKYKKCCGR